MAYSFIFNNPKLKNRRHELRKKMPKAEIILWSKLKGRQLNGFKFRRQYSVGSFVVDFYCPQLKLVIEVDGPSHFESKEAEIHDQERQSYIEAFGIKFLRFTNIEIYENLEEVLEAIIKETET